jgi:hypothetical protein
MKPLENSGNDALADVLGEMLEIQDAALTCIYNAMLDGLNHNYRGLWREQDFDTHLDHAIIHLLTLKHKREDAEDHLSHALCRLAMAATMEYNESEEDSDDVDRWESEGGSEVGRSEAVGDSVLGAQARQRQYHCGSELNHPSGLAPRPAPDTFPTAGAPAVEWWCGRCQATHPYIENCPR